MSKVERLKRLERRAEGPGPIVVVWPDKPEPAAASEPGAIVLRVRYVDARLSEALR